jgi:hypothetical protein
MCRSPFDSPIIGNPCHLPRQSSTSSGRAWFSIPRWCMVALGILALGLAHSSQETIRDPNAADRGLLGEHWA